MACQIQFWVETDGNKRNQFLSCVRRKSIKDLCIAIEFGWLNHSNPISPCIRRRPTQHSSTFAPTFFSARCPCPAVPTAMANPQNLPLICSASEGHSRSCMGRSRLSYGQNQKSNGLAEQRFIRGNLEAKGAKWDSRNGRSEILVWKWKTNAQPVARWWKSKPSRPRARLTAVKLDARLAAGFPIFYTKISSN